MKWLLNRFCPCLYGRNCMITFTFIQDTLFLISLLPQKIVSFQNPIFLLKIDGTTYCSLCVSFFFFVCFFLPLSCLFLVCSSCFLVRFLFVLVSFLFLRNYLDKSERFFLLKGGLYD